MERQKPQQTPTRSFLCTKEEKEQEQGNGGQGEFRILFEVREP